jgi:hypothetical protein
MIVLFDFLYLCRPRQGRMQNGSSRLDQVGARDVPARQRIA